MTMHQITCDEFNEQLPALMEGEVDVALRSRLEGHAATCDDCGPLLADLRAISAEAATLPVLAPSRDLWAGIDERIQAPVVSIGTRREAGETRGRRWFIPAVAAAGLVAVTAAITWYAAQSNRAPELAQRATDTVVAHDTVFSPAPSPTPDAARLAERGVPLPPPDSRLVPEPAPRLAPRARFASTGADAVYDQEITRLRALIATRRAQMDTATLGVIERNLAIIDQAIAQCRQALARDPNSRFLLENLTTVLDSKVQLLRTAAMLPART